MSGFEPSQLAEWTGGRWTAVPEVGLSGFVIDSRKAKEGGIFVALKTGQRDGHDFLAAAQEAGAAAALVSRENPAVTLPQLVVPDPLLAFQTIARRHRQRFAGPVIGISGSVGKTSTKDLLAALLGGREAGVLATVGNLNNHLGVPLTLTELNPEQHKFAVIEAGISGPDEMLPLAAMIEPDVAITTLVAPAHVEALGSIEGVAREKSVLPRGLRKSGVAIHPQQCEAFEAFREAPVTRIVVERADVIRPEEPPQDRVFYTITHRENETAIAVAYGQPPPLVFTLRRVSDGMAQNAVLALCAALRLEISHEVLVERIRKWVPASLRGEFRMVGEKQVYVDCYNANPASMLDALSVFKETTDAGEPRLFVLGGMEELGLETAKYHRELGNAVQPRENDRVVVIGSQASAMLEGALASGANESQVSVADTLEEIRPVFDAFTGTVFLKGSRRYQLEQLLPASEMEESHA